MLTKSDRREKRSGWCTADKDNECHGCNKRTDWAVRLSLLPSPCPRCRYKCNLRTEKGGREWGRSGDPQITACLLLLCYHCYCLLCLLFAPCSMLLLCQMPVLPVPHRMIHRINSENWTCFRLPLYFVIFVFFFFFSRFLNENRNERVETGIVLQWGTKWKADRQPGKKHEKKETQKM